MIRKIKLSERLKKQQGSVIQYGRLLFDMKNLTCKVLSVPGNEKYPLIDFFRDVMAAFNNEHFGYYAFPLTRTTDQIFEWNSNNSFKLLEDGLHNLSEGSITIDGEKFSFHQPMGALTLPAYGEGDEGDTLITFREWVDANPGVWTETQEQYMVGHEDGARMYIRDDNNLRIAEDIYTGDGTIQER